MKDQETNFYINYNVGFAGCMIMFMINMENVPSGAFLGWYATIVTTCVFVIVREFKGEIKRLYASVKKKVNQWLMDRKL